MANFLEVIRAGIAGITDIRTPAASRDALQRMIAVVMGGFQRRIADLEEERDDLARKLEEEEGTNTFTFSETLYIRTIHNYGMTVSQIAKLYGVTDRAVEGALN